MRILLKSRLNLIVLLAGLPVGNLPAQSHFGDSPFSPPQPGETVFLADQGSHLDTGCSFRRDGPLQIHLPVTLAYGENITQLRQNGLLSPTVQLQLPAYDVDYTGGDEFVNPERDQIYFNGHLVPGQFLTGEDETWVINTFEIPIEWVQFPEDPGAGETVKSADNLIEIHIDTANSTEEVWCTAIDWVALDLGTIPHPSVFVHGIFSSGAAWDKHGNGEISFVEHAEQLGLIADNSLNMGNLNSIADNAARIQTKVDEILQRYGVRRVNLVCHSKGGLDSREYVELLAGDKVDQLIQLGTPNAGSPLADWIQSKLFQAGGLPGLSINGLVELFQGPAGIQLTTSYMKLYNSFHGHNPEVEYFALAGHYVPGSGLFDDLEEKLLGGIVGVGDTIVPVSSVYAMPFITSLPEIITTGPDKESTHTRMNGSSTFFERIAPRLRIRSAATAGTEVPLPRQGEELLTTGGVFTSTDPFTIPLEIDPSQPVMITVMYPQGELVMELIDPSGTRWTPENTTDNPTIHLQDSDLLDGRAAIAALLDPEAGTWQVELTRPDPAGVGNGQGYFMLVTATGAAVEVQAEADPVSVLAGEVVRISATLEGDDSTLAGVSVNAVINLPNEQKVPLAMHDDGMEGDEIAGDQIFSAHFADTASPGLYTVLIRAEKPAGATEPGFFREAITLFTVGNEQLELTQQFNDAGADTDNNNLFNWLDIQVGVSVTQAGTFLIKGELTDSQGNRHVASTRAILNTGDTDITLRFSGKNLFANQVDGPYELRELTIATENGLLIAKQLDAANVVSTSPYRYSQFEGPRLQAAGDAVAEAVDDDENGRFDRVIVTVPVQSSVEGTFDGSLRLVDTDAALIDVATVQLELAPGLNNIPFVFDGAAIGRHGKDAPYHVKDLLLFDDEDNSLIIPDLLSIAGYEAREFEGWVTLRLMAVGDPTLNRQTGLYEQQVTIRSESATPVEAARITIEGLPASQWVYNASGMDDSDRPYVQLNQPLAENEELNLTLEYYSENRTVPRPVLNLGTSSAISIPDTPGNALPILRAHSLSEGRILVEFASISGRTYIVEYSPDMKTWRQAVPAVPAFGPRVMWIDDGPPKTASRPVDKARFYRVIELP